VVRPSADTNARCASSRSRDPRPGHRPLDALLHVAKPASTDGESIDRPAGSVTTGINAAPLPPVPFEVLGDHLVGDPALLAGTENFCLRAFDADSPRRRRRA